VIKGINLSEALKKEKLISDYEFYSLEIGEESGQSIRILKELGVFFQARIRQRQMITRALSYPVVVTATAILAIIFMLSFVVPLFAGIFQRMGQDLPFVTRVVLNLSNWLTDNLFILFLIPALTLLALRAIRKKSWFQSLISNILIKIPFLGDYILKIHLIRFCNSMSLLISSGVNIVRSLDLLSKMMRFYPLKRILPEIKADVIKGSKFHDTLASHTLFPGKMIALLKVGEEVNKLDEFFAKISDQYERELETQSSILGSVIEPVILVFLGAVVAFILIAMYLPLFDLNRLF
jgi:type IV pilus assembly protein PilC